MRILVTGGSGFIGRHIVDEFVRRGDTVAATTFHATNDAQPLPESVERVSVTLEDTERLRQLVETFKPECVVHLAAVALVTHPDQSELYRTNVFGTENLLRVLQPFDGTHVILASTAGVYGNQSVEVLDESLSPMPANHYAMSKLAMEHIGRLFHPPLKIRIVRPFNIIGAGQSEAFLVPKLVRHFALGADSIALGNIEPFRDYVDVHDCVKMLADLTRVQPTNFDIVNLCSGQGTSVKEIIAVLKEETGRSPRIEIDPRFVRANEVWRMVGSDAKLKTLVKPSREWSLQATIRAMVKHYQRAQAGQ